jgi:hypothetical protein
VVCTATPVLAIFSFSHQLPIQGCRHGVEPCGEDCTEGIQEVRVLVQRVTLACNKANTRPVAASPNMALLECWLEMCSLEDSRSTSGCRICFSCFAVE